VKALLSLLELCETILRVTIKLMLVMVGFFVALVAALIWKK
jgi:hypothetical protein